MATDQEVTIEEKATPPMATPDQEEEMSLTDNWKQLLVQVGSTPNSPIKLVYLDTSLLGLLYAPSITDPNLATQFSKPAKFDTTVDGEGPFELKNRVIPNAGPTFPNPSSSGSMIVFQESGEMGVFTAQGVRVNAGFFAIYAEAPNNKRIYLRPTTPEVSGNPRENQILGYLLSSEFDARQNFVFKWQSVP